MKIEMTDTGGMVSDNVMSIRVRNLKFAGI